MVETTKLPFRAGAKFAGMCDVLEETHARLLTNNRRIKSLEDQQRHVGELEPEIFEEIAREVERVTNRRDNDDLTYRHQSRLVTALKTFIMGLPASAEIHDAPPLKSPEPDNSEAAEQSVHRYREQIEKIKAKRQLTAIAVPPLDDLYAEVQTYVAALADRGRPRVSVVNGETVIRPATFDSGGNIGGPRNHEGTLAVAAYLHPDVLAERLREQIDETHAAEVQRGVPVLTTTDRDEKLLLLDAELFALERIEEFYVEQCAELSMYVERREDADPRAVLGISIKRPQRSQRAA